MTELSTANKEKLMSDLGVVIADAEEMLRMTANQTGEGAQALRARVEARLKQTKDDLLHLQEVTVEKAKAAGRATDEFVHDNPWKSIGIAAGIGLVVGLLIGRR